MSFSTISNETIFPKTQGTRLDALAAPKQRSRIGLEMSFSPNPHTIGSFHTVIQSFKFLLYIHYQEMLMSLQKCPWKWQPSARMSLSDLGIYWFYSLTSLHTFRILRTTVYYRLRYLLAFLLDFILHILDLRLGDHSYLVHLQNFAYQGGKVLVFRKILRAY